MEEKVRVFETRGSCALLGILRNKETKHREFAMAADRLCSLMAEEGLASIDETPYEVETPCGRARIKSQFVQDKDIVIVDIMRSGAILAEKFRVLVPGAATAKILIQRDEETAKPHLIYSKLPSDISKYKHVILCDPMLATGGSALKAIEILIEHKCAPQNIFFANIVSCPEGLARLASEAPQIRILTMAVDDRLNDRAYICPGLGDFGDRYFGTN